jgi:hypothetical protein
MPKTSRARIRELVRNFKENGMKMLLEHPANVRDLLGLLHISWLDEIDFSRLEVVKTTFIRRDYRHLASDLVYTAPLVGGRQSPRSLLIYLLIEHQSEPERFMPLRMTDSQIQIYRYQLRTWLQKHPSAARFRLRPVLPVVFYTGLRRWPKVGTLADVMECGEEFRPVTPIVERPLFFNLPDISPAQLEREGGHFGWVLRLLQVRRTRSPEFERFLARAVVHLDRMSPDEQQRLGELLSYIRAMVYHERSDSEQSKLQEVMENSVQDEVTRQEVTKMWKTGAEALMERGAHQAGLQTRRQTLVRLLRKRFGKVPSAVVSVVEATDDVDQLDNWLDQLVTADTLEELGIGKQV